MSGRPGAGKTVALADIERRIERWLALSHELMESVVAPSAAQIILQSVAIAFDPVAAFCIVWPSEVVVLGAPLHAELVGREELFAVSRWELLQGFGVDGRSPPPPTTSWDVEHLPAALQRAPFIVPGTIKITLPLCIGDYPVGVAGMAVEGTLPERKQGRTAENASLGSPANGMVGDRRPAAGVPGMQWQEGLSPREQQIARYLADGYSAINIGAILDLSPNTIRTYVRRIYGKLHVCSRVELVRRMRAEGCS